MQEADVSDAWLGTRVVPSLLAVGLVLTGGPAVASTRTSSSAPTPATSSTTPPGRGVEVEVDEAMANAQTTRGWIEERAARAVGALEHPLAPDDLVRIGVRGGPFDYQISLVLLRRGEAVAAEDQPQEIACACGSDEMLETIAKSIEDAARTLDEVTKREREAMEAAEAQRLLEAEEERKRQEAERKRREAEQAGYRPRGLGRAGIGLTGVGGLTMITGVLIAVQGRQSGSADDSSSGYAVLGVGAAAVTAGLTMLVVDVVRCRRRPALCVDRPVARKARDTRWAARPSGGT